MDGAAEGREHPLNENQKQKPAIKTYPLSHFDYGEIIMGETNQHYYLVVRSENNKTQLVDLTDNAIIRDAGTMQFMKVEAELDVKSVG